NRPVSPCRQSGNAIGVQRNAWQTARPPRGTTLASAEKQEDAMKALRTAGLALLSVVVLSCGSVAPIKINAGDQCYRCHRYIHNDRVATETIDSNLFVSKFLGPGCMAKYLAAHPDQRPSIFVTDYTS